MAMVLYQWLGKRKQLSIRQHWYSTLKYFDDLIGVRNVWTSLSPLRAEVEAVVRAMECMQNLRQTYVTFATDCYQLVKMVSELKEWPAFVNYLEDNKTLEESFLSLEIIHVPKTKNIKTDNLAHSVKKYPFFIVYMDVEPPDLIFRIRLSLLSWR